MVRPLSQSHGLLPDWAVFGYSSQALDPLPCENPPQLPLPACHPASLPSPPPGCIATEGPPAREGSSVSNGSKAKEPCLFSLALFFFFLSLILSGGDRECVMVEFSEDTRAQMQGCWRASEPSVCGDGSGCRQGLMEHDSLIPSLSLLFCNQ